MQKTLRNSVSLKGKGLFTSQPVLLTLHPAEPNTGIVFQRIDCTPHMRIPANLHHVVATNRCTMLGNGQISIQTVEHLLSALSALQISNVLIEINGPELPACDGSSMPFVQLIEKAQVCEQNVEKKTYYLQKTIHYSSGETTLIAIPDEVFKISSTLSYPNSKLLQAQFYSFYINTKSYVQDIALSRSFSLYEEIQPMLEKGLFKSAGLENGVIIKDDEVLNPEGLRYSNEMVRHKILDLIGDLSLISKHFLAHIVSIRSGHSANIAFAQEIAKNLSENP